MTPNELKTSYAEADDLRLASDVRYVFSTPAGRRFIMHLLTKSGVYSGTSSYDIPSPTALAFAAGKREAGLHLITLSNRYCPELIITATQERNVDISERNAALLSAKQNQTKEPSHA